jgi:hypothetical protein
VSGENLLEHNGKITVERERENSFFLRALSGRRLV